MDLLEKIKELAAEVYPKVVQWRRHIHANPELSFHETETAKFVASTLESFGLKPQRNIGGNGVIAIIEGKNPDKTIALRADMDALPIQEANQVDYVSKNTGVMHACGHDGHTASLLGTAFILKNIQEHLNGNIKLIFQPAEEVVPGGASILIKEGVLENPKVDAIVGQHVLPHLEAGKIGIRSGMYMASADEVHFTIRGKGGHAAHPHTLKDPVVATSHIIIALQQVASRFADPKIPTVLSFGKIIADGATNVIPNEVHVKGTFRTFNEKWRFEALEKIEHLIKNMAISFDMEADIDIRVGFPMLHNNEDLTKNVRSFIVDYVGEENTVDLDLWPAGEDFAWYTHQVPGCFYRFGTGNEAKGIIHGLHTPRFDIDEDAFKISSGVMAWIAYSQLLNN